ncbi:MAG TPA: insulinase family protein [Ilumatobacteraceae bacterium]|nr:insulinase family protein [Ilumatobacteraceae bacterium]
MINLGQLHFLRWPVARRAGAAIMVAGLFVASCTSSSDVAEVESNTGPVATAAPGSTLAPASVDGSTPITAPDPNGLPSISDPDPAILIGELDNGLRYLIRDNDNPGGRVDMRLVVDAGSALEDDTQTGGAHFLEHMLFNGTEQFPENELIDVLRSFGAAFGADINAYTSYDETVYELTMPTADDTVVETGLDVLEQWLSAATIEQTQVEAERGVVLDEWRGSEASSDGRIFDGLEGLFLTGSPYEGRDPIGDEAAIMGMNAEPLRAFYDDWYRPDNAAVVVVGDIDPEAIEEGLVDRFGPLVARGTSPERPELLVEPSTEPQVVVVSDPDVAEGFAQVTLPSTPLDDESPEAELQASILDAMAFDIVATRLGNDALRGEAPFDDARVDSSGFVRGLEAPEIVVSADGAALEASTQAVFDEYERVRRFGFTPAEVDRAVSSIRTSADTFYEGRDSRQDADFADEYVRHVLTDEPVPTADDNYDIINAILDRATPETVAYGFVNRLADTGAHIMVVVPENEADALPADDAWVAQASSMSDRTLEPRADDAAIDGDLMVAPEPIEERSADQLADGGSVSFVAPTVLEFGNGVRVSLNPTDIVDGQVALEARSPGGLDSLDDADIPAGDAAGTVVANSGVATYDSVELEAFLADKDVSLQFGIDAFTEGMFGSAATSDLEVLFQLIHLSMTQPRVDPVALDQYLDDELAYASDPSIEPGYAEYKTLLDARYDDPAFLLPTVESLNSVTADDVDRVFRDRFGDASDFSFAFSGDFDPDETVDLARRYLGTLPATDRAELVDYVEPPPPPGVVAEQTTGGEGEQASVSLLYTAPASADRADDVAALVVQEVITNRLTDTIREELGDSYSPFAVVDVGSGAAPYAQIYISNTTGADLVDEVEAAVIAQLDDLRSNGPTSAELDAANEAVVQQLDLFSNEQINDEVLNVLTDPAGNPSLDDFLAQAQLVDGLDIAGYLRAWLPADQYIDIRVLPR